jgi:hypothetical protein
MRRQCLIPQDHIEIAACFLRGCTYAVGYSTYFRSHGTLPLDCIVPEYLNYFL